MSRKNILMVDDNPADARLVEEALTAIGVAAKLDVVENAIRGFLYLGRHDPFKDCPTPDLIIMDLKMPVVAGGEALEIIRQDPQWRHIPVFVLSSSTRQSDIDAAYRFGAQLYIIKPTV